MQRPARRTPRIFKIEKDGVEPEWAAVAKKRQEQEKAPATIAAAQAPAPPSPSHLKKSDDAPTAPAPMALSTGTKDTASGEGGPQNLSIRAARKRFDVKDESGNTPVWVSKPGQGQGQGQVVGQGQGQD